MLEEWGYRLQQVLEAQLQTGSFRAVFVVFAAGVVTSFTPCVYPMIPVTVTFMGGAANGSRRRAVSLSTVYVLGLAVVYATLGVVTALLGKTFGASTQSPLVYGPVALLILYFGLLMLDVFSLPVPSFFSGIQSRGAQRGGHFGAVLMGVAAGFVAAPCTAPVLGLLLVYVARTRDVVWGGTLMLAFSFGLGLLLLVLGTFSGLLTSLPRAGAWMSWIKKTFGVGMLLVGAWFAYRTIELLLNPVAR